MRFYEIARIPVGDYGDAETITPQKEPKGSKLLPGGSNYKYHVNRKSKDLIEITLYDKGQIIAELDLEELGAPIPLWRVENIAAMPEYQGKGLGMSLYGIALSILKLTLVAGGSQTKHGARQWLKLSQIPGVEVMGMKTAPKKDFKLTPDNTVLWSGPEYHTYTFPITQGSKSMKSAQRGVGIYNSAGASMLAKWTGKTVNESATIEKRVDPPRGRTGEYVEWIVKNDEKVVQICKTRKEAQRWADIYNLPQSEVWKKYPELQPK